MKAIGGTGLENREILVVDDDHDTRLFLAGLLRDCGARVTTAANGIEAVQSAITGRYDLIVTDEQMPDASGLELIRAVRRMGLRSRIVMITGQGTCETFVLAMESGADAFVRKPFQVRPFLDVLRAALARAA